MKTKKTNYIKLLVIGMLLFSFASANADVNSVEQTNLDSVTSSTSNPDAELDGGGEVKDTDTSIYLDTYKEIIDDNTAPTSTPYVEVNDTNINDNISKIVLVKDLDLTSINGLSIEDYVISFYFNNPYENKITSIVVSSDTGTRTITLNKDLTAWDIAIHINNGKNITITLDGKKLYSIPTSNLGNTYTSLKINFDKDLSITNFKMYYTGEDYVSSQNAKITSSNVNGSYTKDNIEKFKITKGNITFFNVKKDFSWNKEKKKFDINQTVNSKRIIDLWMSTDLVNALKEGTNAVDIINDFVWTLETWTNFKSLIEIDGDTNTKEFVIQLPDGNYFLWQLNISTTTNGVETTYKVNIKKLYKGNLDLSNLQSVELDGDSATKEFYLVNGIYTYIYQYKDGFFLKLLWEKYAKFYFGHLLDKNGTTWKVIFALSTDTTATSGKYYVQPFFKLYWYDPTKNIYFMKQTADYSDFQTFKLKLNGNYIYYKDNNVIDYTKTDYLQ